jgi:hypothetical protein
LQATVQLLFEQRPAPLAVAGQTLQVASHLFSSESLAQLFAPHWW